MNLHADIEQATVLDTDAKENAKFYRVKGLSQAKIDKKMNEREVPTPKNINILEDSYVDNTIPNCEIDSPHNEVNCIENYEISAAIREINGGQDLSNRHWEQDWKQNLKSMNSTKEYFQSLPSSTCSNSPEVPSWIDNHHSVQKHKFLRNAALMGLVRCNIISVEELIYPNYGNVSPEANKSEEREEENAMYEYQIEGIPHDEDSDVLVHPLQKGLDKRKYKHIDFSLTRLTERKIITPQEHYLTTTEEAFFTFVKPN